MLDDAHSKEMLEGVVDAVLRGDSEDFSVFNDRFEAARSGGENKLKVSFGGPGATGEQVDTEVLCEDCGKLLRSSGFRFRPGPDASPDLVKAHKALDEGLHLLHDHRLDVWDKGSGCPSWVWRAKVYHLFANNRVWRRFWSFGAGYAWKHLKPGKLFRFCFAVDRFGWNVIWKAVALVGVVERRSTHGA